MPLRAFGNGEGGGICGFFLPALQLVSIKNTRNVIEIKGKNLKDILKYWFELHVLKVRKSNPGIILCYFYSLSSTCISSNYNFKLEKSKDHKGLDNRRWINAGFKAAGHYTLNARLF